MSTNPTPSAAEPREAVTHFGVPVEDGRRMLCGDSDGGFFTYDPAVTCPECLRLLEPRFATNSDTTAEYIRRIRG